MKYYIVTTFFICIIAYITTNQLLYLIIQFIAYLCYLFKNLLVDKKEENQLEFVIDDINNNIINFCVFLNHFNKVSFDNNYDKRLSESIKILIGNYCSNCKNKSICYSDKKLKTYLFLKGLLTRKNQINSSVSRDELFDCIYYFDIAEKALHLQSQYQLSDKMPVDDLKIQTVCLSIQNYFISIFDKITPQTLKLLDFKKKLIDSNILFFDFKYQIIDHENFHFKIYAKKNKELLDIFEYSNNYFQKFNSVISICDGYIYIHPKRKYKVNYDSATLSLNNHQISGDNILTKTVNEINFICALSDGMGSGFNAYQLSEETLSMVDNILNCNISFDSALQIINNFFKARDMADKFATLDLVDIDLKNGLLKIYKLGSSTTYISRGDKIIPIYNNNLPFGIGDLITKEEFSVCDGDLVILVSDGVNDYIDESVLINYIEVLKNETAHKIVFEILQKIYHENKGEIKDDMSCIAIKIKAA